MKKIIPLYLVAFLSLLLALGFSYFLFLLYYQEKIFPGVMISGFDMGGNTQTQAIAILNQDFNHRRTEVVQLNFNGSKLPLDLDQSDPHLDISTEVTKAYSIGRSGNYPQNLYDQFRAFQSKVAFTPVLTFNKPLFLTLQFNYIDRSVSKDTIDAKVVLGTPSTITPSEDGRSLDRNNLQDQVERYLKLTGSKPVIVPVKTISANFPTSAAQTAVTALEAIKKSPITLTYTSKKWIINQSTLFNLIDFTTANPAVITLSTQDRLFTITQISTLAKNAPGSKLILNQKKLEEYLQTIAKTIDRPAIDARFVAEPDSGQQNLRVREFAVAQEGQALDIQKTSSLITQQVSNSNSAEIELPVAVTKPKVTSANANSMGIKELIGTGVSHFDHSIDNRIFNVGLAASRVNGILIPPGENFSFVGAVGDISGTSGYKQAYVIKSGRTVLDDGGGVCQVSTTVFRAALNSGLPITERTAHAYRVGYYEESSPPGIDATIFSPSVDFKFKNDTGSYILLQSRVEGTTLYIDLYGTRDGRTVEMTTPRITSQTPPLPDIRQDDPTLPKGTIKQVDWPAWGANVIFDRTVSRDGQVIMKDAWRSNYRPWQAVYLVGTG